MLGSAAIVAAWQVAFKKYDMCAGQILVTHNDINEAETGGQLSDVIHKALDNGVVPIINENDVMSDIELTILSYGGDNDGLSSRIANNIGASALLLLTNVDGLLDKKGKVVKSVSSDEYEFALSLADGKSESGRGGMNSKIGAASLAFKDGIKSYIGNASADYRSILNNEIGTQFTD